MPNGKSLSPDNREILGIVGSYLRKESWDNLSPWTLRVRALDVRLTGPELAVALGHIAKHRGFKSNAKNPTDDDGKVLKEVKMVKAALAEDPDTYRTFAELLTTHPDYQKKNRLRNRNGIYDIVPSRELLLEEVRKIFDNQRDLGSKIATKTLEDNFIDSAFFQRPLQDAEKLLGVCGLDKQKNPNKAAKRSSMKAPSFEKFRLFSKLNSLKLISPDEDGVLTFRSFSPEELQKVAEYFSNGPKAKFTFKDLRKLLELDKYTAFSSITQGIDWEKEESKKEVALNSNQAKGSFGGSHALFEILGKEVWKGLNNIEQGQKILDDCADILSFRKTSESMEKAFNEKKIPQEISNKLLTEVKEGKSFCDFTKASHISAKICRELLPHLLKGNVYSKACELAGYEHAAASFDGTEQLLTHKDFIERLIKPLAKGDDTIANPSARKALTEGLKQLWAMRNKFGLPGKIAVELAREVGKSADERGKMERGLKDTTAQRNREREEAAEQLGLEIHQVSGEALLRYRLWKEQGRECLYSGKHIPPGEITSSAFQVDHILPWSRFGDDSFINKTLARTAENQAKKNRTPKEYFDQEKSPEDWERFKEAVEKLRCKGIKKRNYLLLNAKEREKGFRERNLNDTKYATRLFAQCAELLYSKKDRSRAKDSKRRVFSRPGPLTSALRQGWGVERFKKDENGNRRPNDRHHALDAICVACVDEKEILKIQKSFQENEGKFNDDRNLRKSPLPWENFAQDVKEALDKITVARPENRRARGEGHKETIRSFKKHEETQALLEVSSRKSLTGLKPDEVKNLLNPRHTRSPNLKDPERNPHIKAALEKWITEGCPAGVENLPTAPNGDKIHKIVVTENKSSGVEIQTGDGRGLADAASITRVDVFKRKLKGTKGKKKGKIEETFYLLPIYSYQIMNKKEFPLPPTPQEEGNFTFLFALYPGSFVVFKTKDKEEIKGYFRYPDKKRIAISRAEFNGGLRKEFNNKEWWIKTVSDFVSFEKYTVDRFGGLTKINREIRQWHGKTFISAPQDH